MNSGTPITIDNPGVAFSGHVPADVVLCITGLARTGTSAAAQLVAGPPIALPLFCRAGNPAGYHNLEDYGLCDLIEAGREAEARALVDARPARWSFKRPFIHRHADTVRRVIGDRLAWLIVWRDPLASSLREASVYPRPVVNVMDTTMAVLLELAEFVAAVPEPAALVSYEKVLTLRPHVVHQLKRWLENG